MGAKTDDTKKEKSKTAKTPKIPTMWWKNSWLLIGLAVFLIVVAAIFLIFKDDEINLEDLTYGEQLELFTLPEDATVEDENTNNLTIAWVYYREDNYDKAKEFADLITEPNEGTKKSLDELYGLIYTALGDDEKALTYHLQVLEENEQFLLNSAEEDPTSNFNLGYLYQNAQMDDKAIQYYEAFLAIFIDAPEDAIGDLEQQLVVRAEEALEELRR